MKLPSIHAYNQPSTKQKLFQLFRIQNINKQPLSKTISNLLDLHTNRSLIPTRKNPEVLFRSTYLSRDFPIPTQEVLSNTYIYQMPNFQNGPNSKLKQTTKKLVPFRVYFLHRTKKDCW